MKKINILFLLLFLNQFLFAQEPVLVRDLNTGYLSSSATSLFVHGDYMYFAAQGTNSTGKELWRTDGTDTGTYLVKDIFLGTGSSNPTNFCSVGTTLYFSATDGVSGIELWKTDGTANGTVLVKNIYASSASSSPSRLISFNNNLLFVANNGTNGNELWFSDGTELGTKLLKDIRTGTTDPQINNLVQKGDSLFFTANDGTNGLELWVTDGTETGTQLLKDIYSGSTGSNISGLTLFNGYIYFSANDGSHGVELWRTDGTTSGTQIYQDYINGTGSTSPNYLTVSGAYLYFAGNSTGGNELLRTTGNDSIFLIEIDDFGSSTPASLVNCNGTLFFTATVDNGRELYVSNGTKGGTRMTRDLYPIQTDALINNMMVVDSTLYFTAHESPNYQDYEIYYATPSSTYPRRIKDIAVGTTSSNPANLTAFKGKCYFTANDQKVGIEMWAANGNSATLFKDIYPATQGSGIATMAALNGQLLFNAVTSNGDELWKTTGDSASTVLVKDIESGSSSSQPRNMFATPSKVFFTRNSLNSNILQGTDGTSNGTNYVSITGGTQSVSNFVWLNNTLYFVRTGSAIYGLVYKSTNGTSSANIRNLNPSNIGDNANYLTAFKDKVYFSADDGNTNGVELFVTDGSYAGTKIVKDIRSGSADASPANLTAVDSMLFFSANNGSTGSELWQTDGTTANTVLVKDINSGASASGISNMVAFKGKAYFSATDGTNGYELWSSDGTSTGTEMVLDIASGSGNSSPKNMRVVGDLLYFIANDNINGEELWVTDGTPSGTKMLKDIWGGSNGSNIKNMLAVRNYLYFSANDSIHGQELWRTDGTSIGTKLISEVYLGSESSNPSFLTLLGDTLYFSADHPQYGNELFYVFTNCMIGGLKGKSTCLGDTIQFEDMTVNMGPLPNTYLWNFGNGDTSTQQNPMYSYDSAGVYEVILIATNADLCSVQTKKTFTISPKPIANFVAENDTLCFKSQPFKFTNSSSPQTGEPFAWKFGDNGTSTLLNPTHSYTLAGTYSVQLTIGSNQNCMSSVSFPVTVFSNPGAPNIIGKTSSSDKNIDSFYVANTAGSTYNWIVNGGSIQSGNGTDKIFVKWTTGATAGNVQVTETTLNGCVGNPKLINVSLSNVGLNNYSLENAFSIFPNPSFGLIQIENKDLMNKEFTIRIVDMMGKEVYHQIWKKEMGPILSLDLNGNGAGVYQLFIESDTEITSKKFILMD
ncbi:MAG: PKD domain-containing protein [Bacteroidia bacterium]|nr:PKD domain-containing protein [Bacteroidia bacterium]MCF8427914.1 PKD domain-containing protein [Bacteroidia bacterium]MCF8448159.1 PKD domain-containing protein [Bacteroidia bacterium]